jgi:uncharacterized protein
MSFALVTGASKGIGKSIALELASRKTDLLLVARNEELLHSLSENIKNEFSVKCHFLSLDLSATNAPLQVFNWCRSNGYDVNILVNNAGYGLSGAFDKYSLEDHLNMMQLNMNVVVEMTYHFLPDLKKHPRAYILNIASSAAYQSFVLQFSRGLHLELKGTTVSVTCVSPGATDTSFVDRANIGAKGLELAGKFNMQPAEVAKIAVNAMFKGKTEVITGFLNKVGAALAWLLPKKNN